ncbi:MAG: tetratricopeptide repeat protein [Lewinellaceae bacterium]|nr:tetratricopeptide repeat protein [Lewinellaceae bacterium]
MLLEINSYRGTLFMLKSLIRVVNRNQSLAFILSLIFFVSANSLFAQTEIKDNPIVKSLRDLPLDSSFSWMKKNEYIVNDTYNSVGHEIGLQALSRAYLTKNDSIIAEAHLLLRGWHDSTKAFPLDSILYHTEKSVEHYLKTGNQRKIAQNSTLLAYDYSSILEYKKAQESMFRALNIYEALGDEPGIARAYQSLSLFAITMEEPEQSIKYADKAMALFKKADDYIAMAMTYLRYIKSYTMLGQYDKAYQAATDCIELCETKVPDDAVERGFSGRDIEGRAYSARGSLSITRQDYEQALADYTKTWEMSVEDYGAEISRGWRAEMGIACRHLGRYEEALEHLLTATQLVEELGGEGEYSITLYLEIAKCYELMGNYKKALEYQDKAMTIKDKLYQEKIATLETETAVKYETGKKDQALAVQEEQLTQKSKIQNLTLGVMALLATLLFALFYNFRKNKKITAQLEIKNKENELLLKEIHHRVKNNLQTISSLLSLQSESISDKSAYDAVQESKNRVTSMALLHQKLYQGENLAAIEMRDYFETIGKTIIDSFGEKAENVSLEIDMSEIELDVDTAVPIGLITNELITNSIKHAFPNKRRGQIIITLAQEKNGLLKLNVTDDGQPMIDETAVKKEIGFGTLLVQLLTTQLGGKLEKSTQGGTSTIIKFPLQEKSVA